MPPNFVFAFPLAARLPDTLGRRMGVFACLTATGPDVAISSTEFHFAIVVHSIEDPVCLLYVPLCARTTLAAGPPAPHLKVRFG
jgi:hypothetical protein